MAVADGRQLLRIGHGGDDHGRMIPAMSGLARPELLATTEWLAENLDRFGIRVLDLRWRPDGSARRSTRAATSRAPRSSTGATDLIEDGDNGETILLAGPDRMAALAARAGIADGTTVVVYDDSQSLFASRAWWSLRAYGLESVRVLDGGYGDWVAEGRPVSNAQVAPGTAGLHRPRPEPDAPDDDRRPRPARLARRDAARRAGAGRVPRLRGQHQAPRPHPGRGQRAGRGDQRAGRPAAARRGGAARPAPPGQRHAAAGGWSATTGPGSRRPSSRSC